MPKTNPEADKASEAAPSPKTEAVSHALCLRDLPSPHRALAGQVVRGFAATLSAIPAGFTRPATPAEVALADPRIVNLEG